MMRAMREFLIVHDFLSAATLVRIAKWSSFGILLERKTFRCYLRRSDGRGGGSRQQRHLSRCLQPARLPHKQNNISALSCSSFLNKE